MERCVLCGHRCRARRLEGETGVCKARDRVVISSYGPHFGEEPPLVGHHGSGTIFFTRCNLRCVFCQNWDISQEPELGVELTPDGLAAVMLDLQERGCHNVNLVTPTHYLPQILEALESAAAEGLEIPLVYNCGGYEALAALKLLDGVVDIYMPDVKYADPEVGLEHSGAREYPKVVKLALKEMHRQVGILKLDERGIAWRGLLVRHLVLPGGLSGTAELCRFIAEEVSPDTHVNIMDQYRPCYRAREFPPLDRPVSRAEVRDAVAAARNAGLVNLY
jgi:putative pyruvate formate lyase activating enzyme